MHDTGSKAAQRDASSRLLPTLGPPPLAAPASGVAAVGRPVAAAGGGAGDDNGLPDGLPRAKVLQLLPVVIAASKWSKPTEAKRFSGAL